MSRKGTQIAVMSVIAVTSAEEAVKLSISRPRSPRSLCSLGHPLDQAQRGSCIPKGRMVATWQLLVLVTAPL